MTSNTDHWGHRGGNIMEMTTHERMTRMYAHQEADRAPVWDYPWSSTLERWRREGLPEGADYMDFFGLDKLVYIESDQSPRYPTRIVEETDDYITSLTGWGTTLRNWKHSGGVPQFLDFAIKDPVSWAKARGRMSPSSDRINWDYLKANYPRWRREGAWISGVLQFGFDFTHAWVVGTERLLMAMVTDPEWAVDMFAHTLEVHTGLLDIIWEAGYRFDEVHWCDDMGYKQAQFFSLDMYRELLKPIHRRAAAWAHRKGLPVRLHSCGYIKPFIPDLMEIGVDMLNPLEVKAGMDPIGLKAEFGEQLAFHGGINAVLYDDPEALWCEMRRIIPAMKRGGGYFVSSDHSVPQTVSLHDFRSFVELAKELGSYE